MNIKKELQDVEKDPVVKKIEVEIAKALFWASVIFQSISSFFVGFVDVANRKVGFTFDAWGNEIVEQLFHLHFADSGFLIFLIIFFIVFVKFFLDDLGKK